MTAPFTPADHEVLLGDHVVRLEGNVVEVLQCSDTNLRWHVTHVGIEVDDRDDGLELRIGVCRDGDIVGGARIDVPASQRAATLALVEEARRRRGALVPV